MKILSRHLVIVVVIAAVLAASSCSKGPAPVISGYTELYPDPHDSTLLSGFTLAR